MSQAGVPLMWRECSQHSAQDGTCAGPPASNEAIVRLNAGTAPLSAHGCGVTLVPDAALAHFVTLFVGCVREAADRLHLPEDVLFAGVLAHELAHVLLGPAHAGSGLLQARPGSMDWMRFAHNGLTFTPAERRKLRDALHRRTATDD